MKKKSLTYFAWLSIFAAISTIVIKFIAYALTGSVGLLSDALESFINLTAAIMALFALKLAETPPDSDHQYGHYKIEYFAGAFEGGFIALAALVIGYTAVDRIIHPRIIEQAFVGLALSVFASVINFVVAKKLINAGKKNDSITLEADGHHLMTDVWTTVAVVIGVSLVVITGVQMLDPIIAILVAINILVTAFTLIKKSAIGLMDGAISSNELGAVKQILSKYCVDGINYHGLRTRQSAAHRFVTLHILVPGNWDVQKAHDLSEKIEKDIRAVISKVTVTIHLEPLEDPVSLEDASIERV